MVTRVSAHSTDSIPSTCSPVHQQEAPPKARLAARTSFPFNATQTLAIATIVSLVYLPWAIAEQVRSQPSSSSLQLFNETCLPFAIPPLALAAYLRSGFIRAVTSSEHPAAQAMRLHQEKRKLLFEEDYTNQQEQSLRLKEAFACHEAAELAQTPEEKLAWVARGLQELKFPSDAIKTRFGHYEGDQPKCDVALSLFSTQAQALLSLSEREYTPPNIVNARPAPTPLQGTQYGAAQAFRHMAHCSLMLRLYQKAVHFQQRAIQILKEIDTSSYPLQQQIELQEEITQASNVVWNLAWSLAEFGKNSSQELINGYQRNAYEEAMTLQKQYEQLILQSSPQTIPMITMLRATRLQDAAYFTTNLAQRVELLRLARDSVQKEWDQNRETCMEIETFVQPHQQKQRASLWSAPSFSLQYSLLGQLQKETQAAEQQLAQQNKPLEKLLQAGWNALTHWWKSK
jgi:hypothetical protein